MTVCYSPAPYQNHGERVLAMDVDEPTSYYSSCLAETGLLWYITPRVTGYLGRRWNPSHCRPRSRTQLAKGTYMRYLIISDIHANLAAFKAVLDDAEGKYDKVWCLGDLVGYGPDPNECIELLTSLDHLGIAGNHDWAVLGKLDVDDFNPDARHVSLWTRDVLTESNVQFLQKLLLPKIEQ